MSSSAICDKAKGEKERERKRRKARRSRRHFLSCGKRAELCLRGSLWEARWKRIAACWNCRSSPDAFAYSGGCLRASDTALMIGIPRDDRHKITVKIRNNMKRSSSRDTPPSRVKRGRSPMGRFVSGVAITWFKWCDLCKLKKIQLLKSKKKKKMCTWLVLSLR